MAPCQGCKKGGKTLSKRPQYDNKPTPPGCSHFEETCSDSFPYPFTDFPIYILAGTSYLEANQWKNIFPEAILVYNYEQININLSNLGPGGALVINATSTTNVCRDLFLNTLTAAINMFRIRNYHGFYIDDYFDSFPDKTTISDLTPRQSINVSAVVNVEPHLRSYWVGDYSKGLRLEGQLFPQLVNHIILHSVEPPIKTYGLLLVVFVIFIAFIYWLSILVWY